MTKWFRAIRATVTPPGKGSLGRRSGPGRRHRDAWAPPLITWDTAKRPLSLDLPPQAVKAAGTFARVAASAGQQAPRGYTKGSSAAGSAPATAHFPARPPAIDTSLSESDTSVERREVYFSGRVQGVGFRYTTRDIAGRHAVTGFVQNLADGRVLLVAEGVRAELDRLVAAVNAEMARHITAVDSQRRTPSGEFANFEIRR